MADQIIGSPPALQSVSLLFNAAQLALGAQKPPFKAQIQGQDSTTGAATLDIVTLDATLEETHSFTNEITEHPVEQGADITDHVRPRPVELRLRGIVSNTPLDSSLTNALLTAIPALGITAASAAQAQSLLALADASKQTYETLRFLSETGSPCIVYTPFRNYSSMVISSLEITRNQTTGAALAFSVSFREVTTVESASVTVALPSSAQAALDMGQTGPAGASKSLKSQTDPLLKGGSMNPLNLLDRAPAGFAKTIGF